MMKQKRIIAIVLCLGLLCNVFAAARTQGTSVAPCKTHYLNPDTGKVDDGGSQNPDLGEGMCRAAIHEKALLETDGDNTYITVRMQLMSNLRDVQFYVQQTASDSASYQKVTYDVLQENAGADTADMRFAIPRADAYIRCEMYVIPMNRNVVFYLNADSAQAQTGNEDFLVQVQASDNAADKFSDLNGHWSKQAVAAVVQRGLFAGTSDTSFSPEASMTRAMFVTVMGRLANVDTAQYQGSSFADVPTDTWYSAYVTWASQSGIVTGVGDGKFAPNQAISQQELAVMLKRFMDTQKLALQSGAAVLAQQNQCASWASEAVRALAAAGLLTDSDGGAFTPTKDATRAQVAAVLARLLEVHTTIGG